MLRPGPPVHCNRRLRLSGRSEFAGHANFRRRCNGVSAMVDDKSFGSREMRSCLETGWSGMATGAIRPGCEKFGIGEKLRHVLDCSSVGLLQELTGRVEVHLHHAVAPLSGRGFSCLVLLRSQMGPRLHLFQHLGAFCGAPLYVFNNPFQNGSPGRPLGAGSNNDGSRSNSPALEHFSISRTGLWRHVGDMANVSSSSSMPQHASMRLELGLCHNWWDAVPSGSGIGVKSGPSAAPK
jgi:hypothetical protein